MHNLIDKILLGNRNACRTIKVDGKTIGAAGNAYPENHVDLPGRQRRRTRRTLDAHQLEIFIDSLADLRQHRRVESRRRP